MIPEIIKHTAEVLNKINLYQQQSQNINTIQKLVEQAFGIFHQNQIE